jgi:hypothetical protein
MNETKNVGETESSSIADFLEDSPPNQTIPVFDLTENRYVKRITMNADVFTAPELQLHCSNEKCNGIRFFRNVSVNEQILTHKRYEFFYVTYRCSNCRSEQKVFSLAAIKSDEDGQSGSVCKLGEIPPFGPPVPPKLIKLIGPDREIFLKGRRCENQGLGIGAFIYYRRVIEKQKNRILQEVIKVCEKLKVGQDKVEVLRKAVEETRFSEALNMAKDALPESLLIDGHSPMQLLHSALSEGVHAMSDEECLEIASSVRVVLGELSERLSQALKDEAELSKAISHLMHRGNK